MTMPRTLSLLMLLTASLPVLQSCRSTAEPVPPATAVAPVPAVPAGSDGPTNPLKPVRHEVGDATRGREVFRFETFGNEGFWTDAVRLPKGMVAAKLTPIQALKAGLMVDVDALDEATKTAMAAELKTDLSAASAPMLNDPKTTVKLVEANAVIGMVPKDSNGDGKIGIAGGDKVGATCALCQSGRAVRSGARTQGAASVLSSRRDATRGHANVSA